MLLLNILHVVFVITGVIIIVYAHRYRLPEYKAFWGEGMLSRNGFNPFSPFALAKHSHWWHPPGFKVHVFGVCLFGIGVISSIARVAYKYYAS